MLKKYRYQTTLITLNTGLNSVYEKTIETDQSFELVEGVSVIPFGTPGDFSAVPALALGLADDFGTIQERTPISDYLASLAVNIEDRYKAINAKGEGNKIRVSVRPEGGALTEDFSFYVVLKLSKINI